MFCNKCGAELGEGAKFCPKCGRAIGGSPRTDSGIDAEVEVEGEARVLPSAVGPAKHPSRKPITIAGISFAGLIIVGVAAFLLMKSFTAGVFGLTFVNEAAFPDETFRAAVSEQLDTNDDGVLWPDEAASITAIEVIDGRVSLHADGAGVSASGLLVSGDSSDTDSDGIVDYDTGSNVTGGGTGDSSSPVTSLEGIGRFPGITKLVCNDMGLQSLDLSTNPHLEYVDCRGNGFSSLDLSNNAELTTLYCDSGVDIVGMEAAGLYYTDLVVSAALESPSESFLDARCDAVYDEGGRLVSVTKASGDYSESIDYSYDDQGRLSLCSAADGSLSYRCTYDENGRLAGYSSFSSEHGSSTQNVEYTYDEGGRLIASDSSSGGSQQATYSQRTEYSWGENAVSGSVGRSSGSVQGSVSSTETTYTHDSSGRLVEVSSTALGNGYSSRTGRAYAYNELGQCTSVLEEYESLDGDQSPVRTSEMSTEYDESGRPIGTEVRDPNAPVTIEYSCNAEGYVERAMWSSEGERDYRDGLALDVAYVKMIGSLEDRPAKRYVPKLQFQAEDVYATFLHAMWFQANNGYLLVVTVVEDTVQQLPLRATGLVVSAVSNANELKLEEYDRLALALYGSDSGKVDDASDGLAEGDVQSVAVVGEEREELEYLAVSYWAAVGQYGSIEGDLVANASNAEKSSVVYELAYPGLSGGYLYYASYLSADDPRFTSFGKSGVSTEEGLFERISEADGRRILESYFGKGNVADSQSMVGEMVRFDGTSFLIRSADGAGGYEIEASNMVKAGDVATFDCTFARTGSIGTEIDRSELYHVVAQLDEASMFGYHLVSMAPAS